MLLLPTIFGQLHEKTLYIFGAVNILCIVVVWALYPESNQRTLEEMNLVFASDSIWTWDAERNFAKLKSENPQLVQAAKSRQGVDDPEHAVSESRKASLVLRGSRRGAKEGDVTSIKGDSQEIEKSSVSHA